MKKLLVLLLLSISFYTNAQIAPADFISVAKPLYKTGASVDSRSQFKDKVNGTTRDFVSTSEALTYLANSSSTVQTLIRSGGFEVFINSTGTLSAGVITGGTREIYWFRNGVADGDLVIKSAGTSGTASGDLSGTYPSPTVAKFNGQLPSYYLNFSNLTNKPTTITGYGITDALTKAQTDTYYRPITYVPTFSEITGKPTTLSGYGITNAQPLEDQRLSTTNNVLFNTIFASGTIATTATVDALSVKLKNNLNSNVGILSTQALTQGRSYKFQNKDYTVADSAAVFDRTTVSQTGVGKTFTSLVNTKYTIPENRFETNDGAYASFIRDITDSDNKFVGRNSVLQVGGNGQAIKLNSSLLQTVSIPTTNLGTTGVSISMSIWFNITSANQGIFTMSDNISGNKRMGLAVTGANQVYFFLVGGSPGSATTSFSLIDGAWHHAVVSYAYGIGGGTINLYIDGTLIGTNGGGDNTYVNPTSSTTSLGYANLDGTPYYMTGLLDQFVIYNKALSQSEAISIYNGRSGTSTLPSPTNVYRRYDFEDAPGLVAADSNPNVTQYNASLINGITKDNNGVTPISGSSSIADFFTIMNGSSNAEKGKIIWGEYNGRNVQQGKWFQWYQNNNFPLVSDNIGRFSFNPYNSSSTYTDLSASLSIAGGSTGLIGTAALKLPASTLLIQPEGYAVETTFNHIYWTDGGGSRFQLDNQVFRLSSDLYSQTTVGQTVGTFAVGSGNKVYNVALNLRINSIVGPVTSLVGRVEYTDINNNNIVQTFYNQGATSNAIPEGFTGYTSFPIMAELPVKSGTSIVVKVSGTIESGGSVNYDAHTTVTKIRDL